LKVIPRIDDHHMEIFTIEARELTYRLTRAALEKKASDPVLLDVHDLTSYADYFIICSGGSTRQVQAMTDWIVKQARMLGEHPLSVEGQTSGKWVLLDFNNVVMHIFYEPVRGFYDLEGLWTDAPRLDPPRDEPERGVHSA